MAPHEITRRPLVPERARGELLPPPVHDAHAVPQPDPDEGPVLYTTEVRRQVDPVLRPAPPMALRPRLALLAGVNVVVAVIAIAASMPLGPAVGLAAVFSFVVAGVTS